MFNQDLQVQHMLQRKWPKSGLILGLTRMPIAPNTYTTINCWSLQRKSITMINCVKLGAKDTFRTIGVLLNKNEKTLPTLHTPDELSNKFANFVVEKVERIRAGIAGKYRYIDHDMCM